MVLARAPAPAPGVPKRELGAELVRGAVFGEDNVEGGLGLQSLSQLPNYPKAEAEPFLRQVLSSIPMIEGVEPRQMQRLINAMEPVRLAPREVCTRVGVPNDFLFVIQAGKVVLEGKTSREELPAGRAFGQEALAAAVPCDYTAVAGGACQLWRLHRKAFKLLQMDYGARLRKVVQDMMAKQRAAQGGAAMMSLSPMQRVVLQAQQRKRDLAVHREDHAEFNDVPSAIGAASTVDVLGSGNFGEVRLVWHAPTRRAYALKTQMVADKKARAAVDREIAAMREGLSPFLVRFFGETEVRPGESAMLLEVLTGGDMQSVLKKRGRLPAEDARFYLACCICAFDALHAANWVHRDLKLENIMVASNGYAKLIDCGLAKPLKEDQHTFTMCGTPVYFAPEVIKSTGYGRKAEIWALGVLLHELLSGNPPFYPDTKAAAAAGGRKGSALMMLFEQICKQPAPMTEPCFEANDDAADFINMCLRKKATDRPTISDLRQTVFFERFPWEAFALKKMKPPWIPPRHPKLPY